MSFAFNSDTVYAVCCNCNVLKPLSVINYLNTKFYSLSSHIMNNRDNTSNNKRTYVQVEDARIDTFLQFMIDNPGEEIKEAARVTGIKYPRATALWRKNKDYVESQRVAQWAEGVLRQASSR